MRKYFQITFFLVVFGALVLLKQQRNEAKFQAIPPSALNNLPTSTPSSSGSLSSITPVPKAAQAGGPKMMMQPMRGQYRDGSYTGSVEDAFYGNIQVQAKILNGRIIDVVFLQYPNDNGTSISINSQADPMLMQEAIQVQSANVDIISGASASSQAFRASLINALAQAK